MFRKEECVLGTELWSSYAAAKGVQILPGVEECARSMERGKESFPIKKYFHVAIPVSKTEKLFIASFLAA
jgi:hypothetical protein